MSWRPRLLRILRWSLVILSAIVVLSVGLLAIAPTVDLSFAKQRVEESLSSQLGVEVSLESLEATIGFQAGLEARGLLFEAPSVESSRPNFLSVDSGRLKVAPLPLLRRALDVRLVEIQGLQASLGDLKKIRGDPRDAELMDLESNWKLIGIGSLSLRDLEVEIRRADDPTPVVTRITTLEGQAAHGRPIELSVDGTVGEVPFAAEVGSGTLADLIESRVALLRGFGSVGDVELDVDLSVDLETDGWAFEGELGLAASDLARLGRLWNGDLPKTGPVRAAGRLSVRDSKISVGDLELTVFDTTARGELQADLGRDKPVVSGRLRVDSIDLSGSDRGPAKMDLDAILSTDLSGVPRPLAELDAALVLEVARVDGLPLEVTDLSLSPILSEGTLNTALSAQIEGSLLSGSVGLRGLGQEIAVDVELTVPETHKLIPQETSLKVARANVSASGSGTTVRRLLDSMVTEVVAENVALDYLGHDDQMVPARLDRFRLHRKGARAGLSAAGALSEAPLEIEAALDLPKRLDLDEAWTINILGRVGATAIQLEGEVVPRPGAVEFASWFDLTGEISPESGVPFSLTGRQSFADGRMHFVLEEGRVGRTTMAAELIGGDIPRLIIRCSQIDLDQLRALLPEGAEAVREAGQIDLDIPILPAGVELLDADVDITIARLERRIADLEQIQTLLRVRDGRLVPSEFRLLDGPVLFTGQVAMDLRGDEPRLQVELASQEADLGALLRHHGLARSLNVRSGRLGLMVAARGSSLRDLLTRAELLATADEVRLEVEETGLDRTFAIELDRVELRAAEGEPARLALFGALEERAFDLHVEIRDWAEWSPGKSLPVLASSKIGTAALSLETQLQLPLDLLRMEHRIVLEGHDLFELLEEDREPLFRTGPFRIEATIEGDQGVYSLDRVLLETGESSIDGAGSVSTAPGIPTISSRISSDRLELEDFLGPGISAKLEEATRRPPEKPKTEDSPAWDLERLQERLRSLTGSVELDLESVSLGGEHLGSGKLSMELENGVLEVLSESSDTDGSPAAIALRLDVGENRVAGTLRAETRNLDLGRLIERFELEDFDPGRLTLDLEADFDGASRQEILASAGGHLDATYVPDGLRTKLLDLWAGPLLQVVLPGRDSASSRVNCAVAWFTIDGGRMTSDAFYLDTSRIRVRGSGGIDLPTGELDLRLSPRPKSRNLLNLATPVRVQGSWDEPNIRFIRGGLVGTMLKLQLWAITVWRDLTRRPLPSDGGDICVNPPPRTQPGQARPE